MGVRQTLPARRPGPAIEERGRASIRGVNTPTSGTCRPRPCCLAVVLAVPAPLAITPLLLSPPPSPLPSHPPRSLSRARPLSPPPSPHPHPPAPPTSVCLPSLHPRCPPPHVTENHPPQTATPPRRHRTPPTSAPPRHSGRAACGASPRRRPPPAAARRSPCPAAKPPPAVPWRER